MALINFRLTVPAAGIALALASTTAHAESCQPAYDEQLQKAKDSGYAETIREIEALPHIAVNDGQGNIACYVTLTDDLKNNVYAYRLLYLTSDQQAQLRKNDAALKVAFAAPQRDAFEAQLRKMDFAGITIGQSMQEAFDTLKRQHYVSKASGHQVYQGTYHYEPVCYDDELRYGNGAYPSPSIKARLCYVGNLFSGPGPFEKLDENGTRYTIKLAFTSIPDMSRATALKHALVYRIEASVSIKTPAGQDYYEKLANDKYGAERSGRLDYPDELKFTYAGYDELENSDDGTLFIVQPGPDGLLVEFQDSQLDYGTYESIAEKSLVAEKAAAHGTPKPKF